MSDISRDSFRETENVLNGIRGLAAVAPTNPRHYVSLRMQQGVPLLDADWNEQEDIRRIELETILAHAIGSGVPTGSDGLRIREAVDNENNFLIEPGLLFVDGWLVYNGTGVDYVDQPHQGASGIAPALPIPLPAPALAERQLIYVDAWERSVDSIEDERVVDPRIGLETTVRLERAWVVRLETIAADADPQDPATIPNQQEGHRYYPLALVDRPPGTFLREGMLTDLRRTHLTLAEVTHAPLLIDDTIRGQRLDSTRMVGMFRGNLDVMQDLLAATPETFVFVGNEVETWQSMTAFQDVRAAATGFEQHATNGSLHHATAFQAMGSFLQTQRALRDRLQQILTDGISSTPTQDFLTIYSRHLVGTDPSDPDSLQFAITDSDLLGAVLAQERLNEEIGLGTDSLPEGTVTASLVSIIPTGPVQPSNIQAQYQLTVRVQSNLISAQGSEPIRLQASAGTGWSLAFQGTAQIDPREVVVDVMNQASQDVVLFISAAAAAPDSTLSLTARPERRQQLVYNHPPVTLALGQEILPGEVIATLDYQGPPVQPGNVLQVSRAVMAFGVPLPFGVTNLSDQIEQYQVTVTPQGANTGWGTPNEPILAPLNPSGSANDSRAVTITFRTDDELGAVSPLSYELQLVRVTGGANEPQLNASFTLTFVLT